MSEDIDPPARAKFGPPSRRDLLIGGMLATAAGIAYGRTPRVFESSIQSDELEKLVPEGIGPWHYQTSSGIVLPPPDQMAKTLYDQQFARTYFADTEQPVMLVMAYGHGQNGALQVHRPEICYPAAGFRLSRKEVGELRLDNGQIIPIRTFTAESDARVEQVLYWSRIANHMPTGWTAQRFAIMDENLKGFVPDGLLVRVSTISPHREASLATLQHFCRAMLVAAGAPARHKLIGTNYA